MRNIKEEIQTRFRPSFEDAAKLIREEFPTIRAIVSAFVSGIDNHLHVLALECLFTDADADEADLVALCITTENKNTLPEIDVDICWGHPSGYIEAALFEPTGEVTDETLAAIEAGLPKLFKTLTALIARGRPSNR